MCMCEWVCVEEKVCFYKERECVCMCVVERECVGEIKKKVSECVCVHACMCVLEKVYVLERVCVGKGLHFFKRKSVYVCSRDKNVFVQVCVFQRERVCMCSRETERVCVSEVLQGR